MAQVDYYQHDFSKIPVLGLVPYAAATGSPPSSPVAGLLWYDTTINVLKVYNGTVWVRADGGDIPDSTITSAKIADGTIVNADVNSSAAIATTKIAGFDTQVQTSRLDQMAVPTADLNINTHKLTNVVDPTALQDAATKNYVDVQVSGQDWKASVAWATAAVLPNSPTYANGTAGVGATLTAGSNAAIAVDGGSPALNDRVLVKNQASAFQNGIYKVTTVGSGAAAWVLTRATDADQAATDVTPGMTVPVETGGTANGGTIWLMTVPQGTTITMGTTNLPYTQIGAAGAAYTAGAGLLATGNTFDVVAADGSLTVNADNMTVGLVPVSKGGTNATTAASALTNLGVTAWQKASGSLGAVTGGSSLAVTHGLTATTGIVQFFDHTSGKTVGLQYALTSSTQFTVYADISISSAALDWTMMA